MIKHRVVSHLVVLIWQRFREVPHKEIEHVLVNEGWAIGAVHEAIGVYRSTRQFS